MKISENKKLRHQNEILRGEVESAGQELVAGREELGAMRAQLDASRQEGTGNQAALAAMETERKALQRALSTTQQQLCDNLAREPVLQEQIKVSRTYCRFLVLTFSIILCTDVILA